MNPDTALTLGMILSWLTIPSIFAALSDRFLPRASGVIFLIGCGFIGYAFMTKPSGYTLSQIPTAFYDVVTPLFR